MNHSSSLRGLYAITDSRLASEGGLEYQVEQALSGGARIIQYRNKSRDHSLRIREASALKQLCIKQGALLIINVDLELAAQVGADGVHLGKTDPDPSRARHELGPDMIVGVSCYNQFELALEAEQAGADS